MLVSKTRKKGQQVRDLTVRKKFVRGQFKGEDDARRTIASLEDQRSRRRRQCEHLGGILAFQKKDSLLKAFTLRIIRAGMPSLLAVAANGNCR